MCRQLHALLHQHRNKGRATALRSTNATSRPAVLIVRLATLGRPTCMHCHRSHPSPVALNRPEVCYSRVVGQVKNRLCRDPVRGACRDTRSVLVGANELAGWLMKRGWKMRQKHIAVTKEAHASRVSGCCGCETFNGRAAVHAWLATGAARSRAGARRGAERGSAGLSLSGEKKGAAAAGRGLTRPRPSRSCAAWPPGWRRPPRRGPW